MRTALWILMGTALFVIATTTALWFAAAAPPLEEEARKELLVYCGITMYKPIAEIAREIENQEDCRIIITKGGSGNLLHAIEVNQLGDLFLPGSDSYMNTCLERGLVHKTAVVGYNKAAIMVQKGNPSGITNDLANLANPDYYVVIGDPNSGSIGRETKRILERRGIYEAVTRNAKALTTDSKDLVKSLADKEADLVVNWYATSVWPENASLVDAIPIDEEYASRKTLVLGVLACSRHPDIARKFLEYASSPQGIELFKKFGLYDVQ